MDKEKEIYMRYLGCLVLLCDCSVEVEDENRESIEQALEDAIKIGIPIKWRRIVNRYVLEILPEGEAR